MKNLLINALNKKFVENTPEINFDAQTGNLLIEGQSYMENASKFYYPIIEWINEFILDFKNTINLTIKLGYYNTATAKNIFFILETLKTYQKNGGNYNITWYYKENDEDSKEEIYEFQQELDLNINILSFKFDE